jgi:GAF domain-containing protein
MEIGGRQGNRSGGTVAARGELPEQGRAGAALARSAFLGPPPNGAFDAIAELAANRCGTAIAIVHVDADGHESQSAPGPVRPVSTSIFVRPGTISRHADTAHLADAESALANDVPFYAVVPIARAGGRRLGTIAVADEALREIDAGTIADLKLMAKLVADSLELRLSARAELEARG